MEIVGSEEETSWNCFHYVSMKSTSVGKSRTSDRKTLTIKIISYANCLLIPPTFHLMSFCLIEFIKNSVNAGGLFTKNSLKETNYWEICRNEYNVSMMLS